MANTIKIKRSNTASATPNTLDYGELALNYADGRLFYKNSSNQIVYFSSSSAGIAGTTYATTIGNGSSSSFTITHNLNTRDVFVSIRNAASPYEDMEVRWEATTTNTLTLDFSVIPTTNSIRVLVYAAITGTQIGGIDDLTDVVITSAATDQVLAYNGTNWVNTTAVTDPMNSSKFSAIITMDIGA